jgi:Flp pilus assembly protein TadG
VKVRRRDERGSVLMLVPAGILVLLILAAIAIDSAIVLTAQRDLANRAAAAANDIAAGAVSDDGFYGQGTIALDQPRADAYVALAFDPDHPSAGFDDWSAFAETDGRRVTVVARARVHYLFAPAIPGVSETTEVVARSTATARGG